MKQAVLLTLLMMFALAFSNPIFNVEEVFPLVKEHVHAPSIIQLPNGDLFVVWFQGTDERKGDDVRIMGAKKIDGKWTKPFLVIDYPGFPDINPVLFIDKEGKLWLFWYTVMTNLWESSLLRYAYTHDYMGTGAPRWEWQDVIIAKHDSFSNGIKKDDSFATVYEKKLREFIQSYLDKYKAIPGYSEEDTKKIAMSFLNEQLAKVWGRKASLKEGYPLLQRIGWQTGNRAIEIGRNKILLPIYSDGLEISMMAITEDGGRTWKFSEPIVGIANIQPALFLRKDGTLVAFMRNNGPAPHRLYVSYSNDQGMTWSAVEYTEIPNPGSRADGIILRDGKWIIVGNDLEDGRYRLSVLMSDDEGRTWKWRKVIEEHPKDAQISVAYPSVWQDCDGLIHVAYSYHSPEGKTIKHAVFNEEWIMSKE